jgi:transcriptional regulator with XRE-family HTH domain
VAQRRKQSSKQQYRQDIQQLSNNLKWYREQTQVTQVELAARTRLYRTYISMIERRLYNPSLRLLTIIAAGLGIQTKQLLQKRLLRKRRAARAARPLARGTLKQRVQRGREELGANVRQRRLRGGWSQMAFAKKTRTHYTFISLIERSRVNPTLLVLSKIAAAININTAELF